MYASSSKEFSSRVAGHQNISSRSASTSINSLLSFSSPSSADSDAADIQTDITSPTSPVLCAVRTRSSYIFGTSCRLGYVHTPTLASFQGDLLITKVTSKQVRYQTFSTSVVNDEAGYDANGAGAGSRGGNGGRRRAAKAGLTSNVVTSMPTRLSLHSPDPHPTLLRVDTRQQKRVASMVAIRRPSSTHFEDVDASALRLTPIHGLRRTVVTTAATEPESYELRRRSKAEPIGLGIGFPDDHPLRGRAFTLPVRSPTATVHPASEEKAETGTQQEQHPGRLSLPIKWKRIVTEGRRRRPRH